MFLRASWLREASSTSKLQVVAEPFQHGYSCSQFSGLQWSFITELNYHIYLSISLIFQPTFWAEKSTSAYTPVNKKNKLIAKWVRDAWEEIPVKLGVSAYTRVVLYSSIYGNSLSFLPWTFTDHQFPLVTLDSILWERAKHFLHTVYNCINLLCL